MQDHTGMHGVCCCDIVHLMAAVYEEKDMYDTLLALEKDFFRLDKIKDIAWMDSVIHDDFKEIGSSGLIFYKRDVIHALSSLTSDRRIKIYSFECKELKSDCRMVHYITKRDDKELYDRTSIW